MKKITKKEFISILNDKSSVFIGTVFRIKSQAENFIPKATQDIISIDGSERRTVTENHNNYIVFSGGSRLDFNQIDNKEYFTHENEHGITFLTQQTETTERDWDAEEEYWNTHHKDCGELFKTDYSYIVYAI